MKSAFRNGFAFALVTAFATATVHAQEVRLQGGGATFPAPLYQRWVTDYQQAHPNVKIDYQAIGSGGGIKGITDKTFDFAGSDAPLSRKQIADLGGEDKIVQIPTVAGAVVLAYNLPGLRGDLKLDGPVLAEIFLGKIHSWNDPRIAALNGGAALPNVPITTVHRTDGSGTNYIFTNYLATQSSEFNDKVGTGTAVEWRGGGQGGKGSAGVTQVVQSTKGAIGYVELAYAHQNKLPFAQLKNQAGRFVTASTETTSKAGEGAARMMQGANLATPLWNQDGAQSYPIAAFTYVIVYRDLNNVKSREQAAALVDFLTWATTGGQQTAPQLDYAPLPPAVQQKVSAALKTVTFGGRPVMAAAR
jgi:phosphate transport system substrate-binding protein